MTNFNRLTITNTILIVIAIIVALINYLQSINQKDMVYVDNIKLFNGFNMTKDVKVIEEAKINTQAKELDSLYSKLKSLSSEEKVDTFTKNLQQQIAYKSKALQEAQDNYTYNLNQNVWHRLNTYIKLYGQAHDYEIILGTNGNGNVMFAKETIDITNQIIEYANKKYEGH
ncbi:OmpH family outer membrane protein [Flavivirga spongiicola]|uniref:OmpH family outer membrane protein n=1 Tax=Flavivirga spongiicola TaxID=421621 RepID=A0ABU7XMW4_9FLAO|nr:OmpH family outer membrane protein [Flavivirga sp. MEBiC05379]MDO5981442.1 OmpH family outer membrane protein [Flavivirga sp. MEBiC05379]